MYAFLAISDGAIGGSSFFIIADISAKDGIKSVSPESCSDINVMLPVTWG